MRALAAGRDGAYGSMVTTWRSDVPYTGCYQCAIYSLRAKKKSALVCITLLLVNNQLDAQFFMYVYFYSLHVSGSHVPIIRRIIVSMRHLV